MFVIQTIISVGSTRYDDLNQNNNVSILHNKLFSNRIKSVEYILNNVEKFYGWNSREILDELRNKKRYYNYSSLQLRDFIVEVNLSLHRDINSFTDEQLLEDFILNVIGLYLEKNNIIVISDTLYIITEVTE